jgi:hypothetical protein
MGCYDQESLTVSAVPIAFTNSKLYPSTGIEPITAIVAVETTPVRFTVDGTVPSEEIGTLLGAGDVLTIEGERDIQRFSVISSTGVTATCRCNYFDGM